MIKRLRIMFQGLCSILSFVIFGLGSCVLAFIVIPILWLAPVSATVKKTKARKAIKISFWLFRWTLRLLGQVRTKVIGLENIPKDQGCVIIANHQTLFDVVLLMSYCPESICIIKGSLMKLPTFRIPALFAGFVPNMESMKILDQCMKELSEGRCIILFPEGTRAESHTLRRFKRGAANLALRGRFPLVPVFMSYDGPTIYKGHRCYQSGDRICDVTLSFSEPLDTHRYCESSKNYSIAARKLTADLEQMYQDQLGWSREGEG